MNDHTNDWRNEINWPYARRFLRAHVIMWTFGFVLTLLSALEILVGANRKFLGVLALLIFAASLVGAFPIFGKTMRRSWRACLLLQGFFNFLRVSALGCMIYVVAILNWFRLCWALVDAEDHAPPNLAGANWYSGGHRKRWCGWGFQNQDMRDRPTAAPLTPPICVLNLRAMIPHLSVGGFPWYSQTLSWQLVWFPIFGSGEHTKV